MSVEKRSRRQRYVRMYKNKRGYQVCEGCEDVWKCKGNVEVTKSKKGGGGN